MRLGTPNWIYLLLYDSASKSATGKDRFRWSVASIQNNKTRQCHHPRARPYHPDSKQLLCANPRNFKLFPALLCIKLSPQFIELTILIVTSRSTSKTLEMRMMKMLSPSSAHDTPDNKITHRCWSVPIQHGHQHSHQKRLKCVSILN